MIKVFRSTLTRYRTKFLVFGALYALLAVLGAVSNTIALRVMGDMTQAADAGETVLKDFFIILAVTSAVGVLAGALSELMSKRKLKHVESAMRQSFAQRLARVDYKTLSGKNSGEGASIFSNDLPLAASFATTNILAQVSQIVTLIVATVFMLYINWWVTLIYFAMFPLLVLLQAKISVPIEEMQRQASQKKAEMNAVFMDALQNPVTLKSYGLEASVERRFSDSYDEFFKATMHRTKTAVKLLSAGIIASISPSVVLSIIACALVLGERLTLAEFIALWLISEPVISWLIMFSQEMAALRIGSASATRLLDFTGDGKEEDASNNGMISPSEGIAVDFKNVSFAYTEEEGKNVIDDLSLSIEKGKITVLSGESGCGKSTVMKLMLGLYAPDTGSIDALQRKGYVPQDSYLLPVSVKENILCSLSFEEEKFISACKSAGILDFITGLPDGYDTVLTESAANISGGQKQRIAIARAFYQDPDLLLMDESTSALDPATEQLVLQEFCDYIKNTGKTAVVVAHRQSVIDLADNVIALTKGA